MELSKFLDNKVWDQDGNQIGVIEELLLDTSSGCVSHAVIVCPNKTRFRVTWERMTITTIGFILHNRALND